LTRTEGANINAMSSATTLNIFNMKIDFTNVKPLLLAAEIVMVVGAIIGAALLAFNIDESKWGYLAFLISSSSGIYVGIKQNVWSLTALNLFFTVVNIIGVYRWILA